MNLPVRLSSEMLAIVMIGDGVLTALRPRQHVGLWRRGPGPWRNLVEHFEDRQRLTAALGRGLGAGRAVAGVPGAGGRLRTEAHTSAV